MLINRSHFYSFYKRYDVVNEAPAASTCQRFNISRGELQAIRKNAFSFACMVTALAGRLNWFALQVKGDITQRGDITQFVFFVIITCRRS
jgi:hypothetical protein